MKILSPLAVSLTWAVMLLAGCGGGGDSGGGSSNAPPSNQPPASPPPSGGPGPQRPASVAGFVYAIDSNSNTILAYTINAATGGLAPVEGSPFGPASTPFPTGVQPHTLAVDPAERFVHVANYFAKDVSVYAIDDATGKLAQIPGSPYHIGNSPQSVGPTWIRIHPSGKFAYVQTGASFTAGSMTPSEIWAFARDSATGQWSAVAGSPFPAGSDELPLTFDQSGRFAYLLSSNNGNTGSIATFAIDGNGALTRVGTPVDTMTGDPRPLAITPSGHYGYVTTTNFLLGLRFDPATGVPARIEPIRQFAGGFTSAFQVHPSGKFGYLTSSGSARTQIAAFAIDDATGNLSDVEGSPYSVEESNLTIVLHPSGNFAYVTKSNYGNRSGAILVFAIDAQTGALSEIAGSPYDVGPYPRSLTIDPSGRVAYVARKDDHGGNVADEAPGDILAYTIDTTTGALASVNTVPAGVMPVDVTIAGTKR